jgi:hypothetical protein
MQNLRLIYRYYADCNILHTADLEAHAKVTCPCPLQDISEMNTVSVIFQKNSPTDTKIMSPTWTFSY